jgi:hypothetical protein
VSTIVSPFAPGDLHSGIRARDRILTHAESGQIQQRSDCVICDHAPTRGQRARSRALPPVMRVACRESQSAHEDLL